MEDTAQQRRLATILAADVVGYSGLMARDEEATVRTLRAHREIIDRLIARHDGRIFSTAGDSVLAEFGSAVEAVRCAITIQDELRVRNAELVPERQMLLRIGVNVGDVLVDGDNLLGDGVNIAARLEGVAQPGGICISGSTFEQVKNKLSVGFEDLGPQQVKNIPDPVAAFGITAAPVTIAGRTGAATAAGGMRWRRPAMLVAGVVLTVAIAGVAYWRLAPRGALPLSAFPENISTDEMDASDIASLVTGMTIAGRRQVDDRPFRITLAADGVAAYAVDGESGTALRETGRWWAYDRQFCLQVPQFAQGSRLCPRIVKTGPQIAAVRPTTGIMLPWMLTR
jgi:class 3 adenylate cyclase